MRTMQSQPEVILVHGAWHGPWCWDGVVDELRRRDVAVVAVELPFRGFRGDVDTARRAIQEAPPGSVVVGHSFGGLVISEAARDASGIARMIYLAAFMLDIGEDPASLMIEHGSELLSALSPEGDGMIVDPTRAAELFYGDSDEAGAAAAIARLRAMPLEELAPVEQSPAWCTVPSMYVICTADEALPPSLQRQMAVRAGAVVEWPTDHSPFLTRPGDVAALAASLLAL